MNNDSLRIETPWGTVLVVPEPSYTFLSIRQEGTGRIAGVFLEPEHEQKLLQFLLERSFKND